MQADDLPLPFDYNLWNGVADTTVTFYRTRKGTVGNTLENVKETQASEE